MKNLLLIFLFSIVFNLSLAHAGEKISDIRIEGLQRINPGLVFDTIPFEIAEDIDSIDYSKTISLLYKTGHFKDVVIEKDGSNIIISLREKPLLYELNFYGTESFQPEALTEALASMGIGSGMTIDEADLARAEKELSNQFLAFGKYSATVKYEIIPLTNNRVNVNFNINEGPISRIKEINFTGNQIFNSKDLLDELELKTTNIFSWWNKDDRYSKQTLSGDLEKIKSLYMNKGFLDFRIDSSIVSISKNRNNVFINIAVSEGHKYVVGDLKVSGEFPEGINEEEVKALIKIKKGDTFNRKLVNNSVKNLSDLVGNYGYAFANVNALPNVDRDSRKVDFNFSIDLGKKIYVRRVNIIGNESSKDAVVRREMRQYESSWFSQEKVQLSKQRLDKTQYFEEVNIETPTVPGTSDQVDLNVFLKEQNTGKFSIGAGVSSSEGIVGTLGLSQSNFLGTGNLVSTNVSLGGINKVYSLSFVDPYWTDDGVSRGFTSYYRDYDTKDLSIGDYQTNNLGFGMNFGIPLDEYRKFSVGATLDFTELQLLATSPQKYQDYCSQVDKPNSLKCNSDSFIVSLGWYDDTTDNPLFTTKGHKLVFDLDVTLPGLDLEYYKATIKAEKYFSISSDVVTKIKGTVGYADSYGDDPYPFFKNFRVGGKSTVRGYSEGSIGKKFFDVNSNGFVTYGGEKAISGTAETYFPLPFVKKSDQYRLSVFVDGGLAFEDSFEGSDIRYSTGVGILWISPFGPISASIAIPLNEGNNDKTEKFQFGMGSSF